MKKKPKITEKKEKMACFFYAKKIKTNRGYKEEKEEKMWRGGVENRKKYIGPID